MGRIIGIDFGTTNSVVSVVERGRPKVIPNHRGETLTPSVVGFFPGGESVVGTVAKNQSITNPTNTVLSVKRLIGTGKKVAVEDKEYTPEEIVGKILTSLKKDAEEYLGEEVTEAIITVPAYFSDSKRQATKDAGRIAGLKVMRIVNEPTAAALAYGIDSSKEENILVYDLGGGTFDVSILEIGEGVFEVRSTAGDNFLGGDDFDNLIINMLVEEFKDKHDISLASDPMAMQKLKVEAEKAKISLSDETSVNIDIPFISADESGPKHIARKLTRKEFEKLIDPLIEKTVKLSERALKDIRLDTKDIDRIILVGGSTRIPIVKEKVSKFIGTEAEHKINPEESVAFGAAVQCGIIKGEIKGMVLVDVTPLSLGIEIDGGLFVPLIERNSPIPCQAKKIFTTISDKQSIVEIHILQGERKVASENISLGKFQITEISEGKKGEPRIEVTFNIDVDGIVSVSAIDLETKSEGTITLTDTLGLSEDDIEEMIKTAEKHRYEDAIFQKQVETQNDCNALMRKIEKYLEENDIEKEKAEELKTQIKKLNELVESDDDSIEDFYQKLKENFENIS